MVSKGKTRVVMVLSALVAVFLAVNGVMKLVGDPSVAANFDRWGYPGWFMVVTGSMELLASVLVAIPRTRFAGAGLIGMIMVGAIATHIRVGEWVVLLVLPLPVLLASAVIAFSTRPSTA